MSQQFEHVSIDKHANIYFDGSVISYNLRFPDHARKTIGVILPSTVKFATDVPEIVEIVSGKCRVRIGSAQALEDMAAFGGVHWQAALGLCCRLWHEDDRHLWGKRQSSRL